VEYFLIHQKNPLDRMLLLHHQIRQMLRFQFQEKLPYLRIHHQ
jgi:hypothetical protein